jgi:hypothetical protein
VRTGGPSGSDEHLTANFLTTRQTIFAIVWPSNKTIPYLPSVLFT